MKKQPFTKQLTKTVFLRLALFLTVSMTGICGKAIGQVASTLDSFVQYERLPALQNPDRLLLKPQPTPLFDEVDFHVFQYNTPNPLQIKLLIGNQKGRRWTMRLETDDKDLLYLETQRTDWAWQLLNLEDLLIGRYHLSFSSGPYQLAYPFTISRLQPVEWTAQRIVQF